MGVKEVKRISNDQKLVPSEPPLKSEVNQNHHTHHNNTSSILVMLEKGMTQGHAGNKGQD